MKAIVPVAGIGTRLKPHTHTMPKALIHVAGKPILGHILDRIVPLNPTEVVLIIGHMGEKIIDYVEKTYDFKTAYVQQERPEGIGHAVYLTRDRMGEEPVLIVLGDTVLDADLRPVVRQNTNAIGVKEVEDPRRFGVVITEDGWVTKLVEKPDRPVSNLAIAGVYYIVDTRVLLRSLEELIQRDVKTKGEYQLTDSLQMMLDQGAKMCTFTVDGWYDCGKVESLLATNTYLLQKSTTKCERPGSIIVPPVAIAESARVTRSIIGPNVSIAGEALIEGSIVRDSIVGEYAEVRDCLLASCLIGDNALVRGGFQRLNVGDSSEVSF